MDFGKEFKKYATKHANINSMYVDQYVDASLTPYIIEERQMNVAQMDVFSRLHFLKWRLVLKIHHNLIYRGLMLP